MEVIEFYLIERMIVNRRRICGFLTMKTNDMKVSVIGKKLSNCSLSLSKYELSVGCKVGIDSHADTSCAGKHVRILERIDGKSYSVSPFNDQYKPLENVKMINGIVAVDRDDGSGFIVELNNFLDFTDSMNDSIVVPMQARLNHVIVNDVPRSLCSYNVSTQSIIFPENNAEIPIEYNGPIPFFRARYPSDSDMDSYQWISLTGNNEWEPYSLSWDTADFESNDVVEEYSSYSKAIGSVIISATSISNKSKDLSPGELSEMWKISLPDAVNVLNSTTALSRRIQDGQMTRRFRTDLHRRRYRRLGGQFARFYTDTLFFGNKSIQGNSCAQIYVNRAGYTKIYPLASKSNAHESLTAFIHEVGIPGSLHSDDAKELVSGVMLQKMRKYEIFHTMSEPYSPWQNRAENAIGILKSKVRRIMRESNTPIRLIEFAMIYVSSIRNFVPSHIVGTRSRTPHELVHNETPDISEYATFNWFEFVWYWNPQDFQKQNIGRWLGVADSIGSGHVYYILTIKGTIVARSTVTKLSKDELKLDDINDTISKYKDNIKSILGDYDNALFQGDDVVVLNEDQENILFQESPNVVEEPPLKQSDVDESNEMLYSEVDDWYIGAHVKLPHHGKIFDGKVVSRKRTADGRMLIGKSNPNPILDTRVYNVEFVNGDIEEFTTNIISESIFDHSDDEGYYYNIFKGIIGHRKGPEAVNTDDGVIEVNGRKKKVVTTKGWDINVEWVDGTSSWLPLRMVKNSYPVEMAEYAISRRIQDEPAFAWWINKVIRKRERIISKLRTTRKVRRNIKFGVKVPFSVEEAKSFDHENNNTFWEDAIKKELSKVRVAFELIDEGESPLPGSKKINYHFVFDVKHDLMRKARLVAGGHLNKNVPTYLTYSSVISKETVRICFMSAALNGLNVLVGDISNAYLNAKPRERCHVVITDPFLFGPSNVGKTAQIVRALYGMKSSGAAWRDLFASVLHTEMGFTNCMADHDLWMHPDVSTSQQNYYSYICIYVDDVMIVSEDPNKYMDQIKNRFLVKPESIEVPKRYLGMDCKQTEDGVWLLGSYHYLQEFLKVSAKLFEDIGIKIPTRGVHPFSNIKYRPELDTSDFCNDSQTRVYQQVLGMLRWLIELGRIDVLLETTLLASYLMNPRIGHLLQACNIVAYLRKHQKSTLMMDPAELDICWNGNPDDHPDCKRRIMRTIYRDAHDDVPPNSVPPRGKSIQINVYCDSDHAGDKSTRRSHSGIIIFVNMAPISWFSRKQSTIETSTFGSEYIALRIAIEKVISLRYKLRMMGIGLNGSANIFMDNESVVRSGMNPDTVLKKKHVSIAYHKSRESFAANIITIYWIPSEENLADLLTKVLDVVKRKNLFRSGIFY